MDTNHKGAVCAIIVAAGKGSRMGLKFNKVFAPIKGVPVIQRTLEAFLSCQLTRNIVLVISPDDETAIRDLVQGLPQHEQIQLVYGGAERQSSVYNGLLRVPDDTEIVLIHDGARPFVDKAIIKRSIEEAQYFGAACCGMPVKDTIKLIDEEGFILNTPQRSSLWSAQTPQSFKKDIILNAHKTAALSGLSVTDDAMLVESMGLRVKMFEGSYRNIKITSTEDLELADSLASVLDEALDS